MDVNELAPWADPSAAHWMRTQDAWQQFAALIKRTLENDPRRFPQQIRAAAAFVILFCRQGLWPAQRGIDELDELVGLARRQLSQVRQLYSAEARHNPEVSGSPDFRALMKTLDEEMRCLDARIADSPLNIPNSAPSSWGTFFP